MSHPLVDSETGEYLPTTPGIVIADGHNISITVREKCLVIIDGPRSDPQRRAFQAAQQLRGIRHLVILGGHGSITLEAYRWLADNDVTYAMIDMYGKVIREEKMPRILGTSGHYVDPILERRQAWCYTGGPMESAGIEIIRGFKSAKLEGQAWNAEYKLGDAIAAKTIRDHLADLQFATSLATMEGLEGAAAAVYFTAWRSVTIKWRTPKPLSDKGNWHAYPGRPSANYKSESNRNASDPINAMLNWGYKILESEVTLAILGANMSPTMGIDHVDLASHRHREAFALDMMEAVRPAVDEIVLDIVQSRALNMLWFMEDRDAVVTLKRQLAHEIAYRVHEITYKVQPHVNRTKRILTGEAL